MLASDDVPAPVLFNIWKHHAGAIRQRITGAISAGPESLARLPAELRVIGADLMDFYVGALPPPTIGGEVLRQLAQDSLLERNTYGQWLDESGGFRVLALAEDRSRWVLRLGGDDERFVHIHPARASPHTRRVRANVLKTAILVLTHTGIQGGNPLDIKIIDSVRRQLDLPPVGKLVADRGLAEVIQLLQVS